jgi:mRNA interferase MazF
LAQVLVAPVTTNVRSIPTELPLDPREGVLTACAASMDNITTLPKVHLVRRMGAVDASRKREICRALAAAVDC